MNKSLIIPLAVLAVMLPTVGFLNDESMNSSDSSNVDSVMTTTNVDSVMTTTNVDLMKEELSFKQIVQRPELIVVGEIVSTNSYEKKLHEFMEVPIVFTDYDVKVDKTLKGEISDSVLTVTLHGGTVDNNTTYFDRSQLNVGDKVVLLLLLPGSSFLSEHYQPVDEQRGVYLIDGNNAKNHEDKRNISLEKLQADIQDIVRESREP